MRKIINSTYITLDGVVENPHLWPALGKTGTDSISDDLVGELKRLKAQPGKDINTCSFPART